MADIESLSPTKQALLEQWLQGRRGPLNGEHAIPARNPDEPVPLSFQQHRLWFLDQLSPGGAFANIDVALLLDFPLNPGVLHRALNELVRRHDALRTTFYTVDGEPVQVISSELIIEMPVIDLRDLGAAADERAIQLATEGARRPFDLAVGPLIRATALRLAPARWVLAVTMHHIVSDGWSLRIFFDELAKLYEAIAAGKPSPLAPISIQYPDFAAWQRQTLGGDQLDAHLAYWKTTLADLPLLELPADRARPPVQSFAGSTSTFTIPADVVQALSGLCTVAGATLYMGALTGFGALLSRYTGQTDLPVGTYVAGRNRAEVEPLIGFFVSTLVMRIDLAEEPSFREALGRVREVALSAYAHQDVPFEKLVEVLAPPRDPSRNPLVQIAFQLVSVPKGHRASGTATEALAVERGATNFDICCSLIEQPDGTLNCHIEYSTELFNAATIDRMARHYQQLLSAAVATPDVPMGELELMNPGELAQLGAWNATETPFPVRGLAEHFADQVRLRPNQAAILHENESIKYIELDKRSDAIASALVARGISPESIVGVFLERSVELVASVIAIAKVGAAYLPLDPAYPIDRISYIVADSEASVVITRSGLRDQVPSSSAALILVDELISSADDRPIPPVQTRLDRLAYVVYTSGSTGTPKGVAVEEAQVINRLVWGWRYTPFCEDDVSVIRTSTSFVDSLWELWGPLLAGSPAVIAPDSARVDVHRLIALLARHRVSRIWLVPSYLRAMLDAEPELGGRVPSLKMVVTSGEPLTVHLAERFHHAAPCAELYNCYGISEIWDATWHRCAPGASVVPIGVPIANVQCLVLDTQLRPVPIGVPGELCVAGIGVARGYLNRPEMSAERFIDYPGVIGGRLYRTGDRARWRQEGVLEYLGRIDQQVKVRGVRIEPAEVEGALLDIPNVEQAAVKVWTDEQGRDTLVAYVICADGVAPGLSSVRQQLGRRLPDPMIPTALIALERFPQTPSGKLDRRSLPPPGDPQHEGTITDPRNAVDATLLHIWSEVLGSARIGINDNFFDLGGHSLLAIQIVSRLRATFDVDLPLQVFFNTPSIAGVSEAMLADQTDRGRIERIADLAVEIANLSDDEVQALLETQCNDQSASERHAGMPEQSLQWRE